MNRNIELKAKATNFAKQKEIARKMSDSAQETLIQEDTFFIAKNGRLKLRKFSEHSGELIFYKRANLNEAKTSQYKIVATDSPDLLKETLSMALSVRGIVKKTRYLFISGQTRIHLDSVENLGEYIEFEYVLKDGESKEVGKKTLKELQDKLLIKTDDLVSHAYIDLLLSHQ